MRGALHLRLLPGGARLELRAPFDGVLRALRVKALRPGAPAGEALAAAFRPEGSRWFLALDAPGGVEAEDLGPSDPSWLGVSGEVVGQGKAVLLDAFDADLGGAGELHLRGGSELTGTLTLSAGRLRLSRIFAPEVLRKGAPVPAGRSGLPAFLEPHVPPELRFWKLKGVEARAARDALRLSGILGPDRVGVVNGAWVVLETRRFAVPPPTLAERAGKAAGRHGAAVTWLVAAHRAVEAAGEHAVEAAHSPASLAKVAPDRVAAALVEGDDRRLVAAAAERPGDAVLVAREGDAGAVAALAGYARLFTVPGVPGHVFATSLRPDPSRVAWVDAAKGAGAEIHCGLPVVVDRPKGYVQEGVSPEGEPWTRTYATDYGHIAGTEGGDGEALDCFLGPDEEAEVAWVVEQVRADGGFDEWKLMLGFGSAEEAVACYLAHVPERHKGEVHEVPVGLLRGLVGMPPAVAVGELAKRLAREEREKVAPRAPVSKPFAGYETFEACVAAQRADGHGEESARAICGRLQADAEKGAGPTPLQEVVGKGRVVKALPYRKDGDERYALGIVLEPQPFDGRGDLQGDTYSEETVRAAAHEFMVRYQNMGLDHEELANGKVLLLESYVAPADFEVGGEKVKRGTWLMACRYVDDDVWASVKSGERQGFSIGGDAIKRPLR